MPGQQAFRVTIEPSRIGLAGESDVSTSYAIYELLDRLGCRWFMPGELGEDVPKTDPLQTPARDDTLAPSTLYRGIWYADADFKRRNRLGGIMLSAGHMLERWITPEQRAAHPEFRAVVSGKASEKRVRWSNPEVAHAMAETIQAQLEKIPTASISLSPADGLDFDEGDDRKLDAGDWDPSVNSVSLTDRLMVLTNRVAKELEPRHPELLFGVLAYASYTRPPVREKVHPNVVPVIAPITYCRAHPWSSDACPGAKELRAIIEGWSKRADKLAFRGYAYNLAEPAAPFPLIRKWSDDLPYLFSQKTAFFQPETLPNFETTLPGLYLALRLSWNVGQSPAAILDDLFNRFYGHASEQAKEYWKVVDAAWTNVPEYSGGGLGHARRFTPELLKDARRALDATKRACANDIERDRVALLDASLQQLELYMRMDGDFKRGAIDSLANNLEAWMKRANALAERYAPNAAFARANWARGSVYASYVKRFLEPAYLEADRIYREHELLNPSPSCQGRYRLAPTLKLPTSVTALMLESADKTTNFCNETWSTLGQDNYFGAMWYELDLQVTRPAVGKRAWAWLSKIDGIAQVWLNGTQVNPSSPILSASAAPSEAHLGFLTYDISDALSATGPNRLTILIQRTRLVELGAGGLMGPVYLYRER